MITANTEGLSARLRREADILSRITHFEGAREAEEAAVDASRLREIADALDAKDKLLGALTTPRPQSEWTEEDGDVLWWHYPIQEPPYCGSMLDVKFDADWHRWWTELPDGNAMEAAIRAKAGDL